MRPAITLLLLAIMHASAASAAETTISLDRRDCARLVRHVASANVAFTPGIDARGRTVVPADAGGAPQIALPDRFEFVITVDLGDRLGIPVGNDADYIARLPVGTVIAGTDGQVTFNGVALTDAEAADLAARCQKTGTKRQAGGT